MTQGRAAVVELVRHAPRAFGRFVSPAQVRIAQAVLAQVLPGAANQHHLGAAARVLGVQRLRGLRRQRHARSTTWGDTGLRASHDRPAWAGAGHQCSGDRQRRTPARHQARTKRGCQAGPGPAAPPAARASSPFRSAQREERGSRKSGSGVYFIITDVRCAARHGPGRGHKGQGLARHRQITPVPMTLQVTTVPTPCTDAPTPRPATSTLTCAPSDARSSRVDGADGRAFHRLHRKNSTRGRQRHRRPRQHQPPPSLHPPRPPPTPPAAKTARQRLRCAHGLALRPANPPHRRPHTGLLRFFSTMRYA